MYIESYTDESTGITFPAFSSSTKMFVQVQELFIQTFVILKLVFEDKHFLIDVITQVEDKPEELGGVEALFSSLKMSITVNNLLQHLLHKNGQLYIIDFKCMIFEIYISFGEIKTMQEFQADRQNLLDKLYKCSEYVFEMISVSPFWCILDFLQCLDPHNKCLYNIFTDCEGKYSCIN